MSLKIASRTYYSFSEYKGNVNSIDSIDGNGIVIPEGFVSIGSIWRSAGMIIPDTVISIGEIYYSSLIIPASVESISKIKGSGDRGNDENKITISLKSKMPPMIGDIVDLSRFDSLMVPQGTWKWPVADYSVDFDEEGNVIGQGKLSYTSWPTDYKMYTYDENKILESWKLLCAEESSM